MKVVSKLALLSLALILSVAAQAADRVHEADANMYPSNAGYNPAIPTPESFLGFELGEEPVRHHQLVDYLNLVAGLSDRMTVETIGYSHERRPILFLVITSPENHARLGDIKSQHVALTEPELDHDITEDMPVVTWLNYGVHGAESSGMDAAVPTVYHLAAATDPETERLLSESVVLITAIFNPDGHNQRINWFDAFGGSNNISDSQHIEHSYNWQFARTNHYFFDLNRQWLLLTQPEPRAWMKKWHEWRPNLTVDYHEMSGGQTYYFHPGTRTRTNPLVPDEAQRLMAETVKTSEQILDEKSRLYFHGEDFDNYYIGKGSTFPLINGGVGILYEAGAALGRELETDNGLRTYRDNIMKHFRTSIASIEGGANLRLDYLRYQQSFYESALEEADESSVKAYVFSAPDDPARMHFFVDLLNYHRISAFALTRDITVNGSSYSASNALIVPLAQPQYRLIRSLFETVTEFEDATFYDVSTWTMPLAFGLNYSALSRRNYKDNLKGDLTAPALPVASSPVRSDYGYAFTWDAYFAPKALGRILEQDVLARVATKPFVAATARGDVSLPRGTVVVPLDRQSESPDDILALVREVAAEDGVTVYSLSSGRSVNGTAGVNVGGPSFVPLERPRVLLVVGDDTNLYDAGEVWHLLDYRMDMAVTLRPRDQLNGIDWNRYTHVVFPAGEFDDYEPEFADRLRLWVSEGGTVIGMRQAAQWVRDTVLDYVDPEGDDLLVETVDLGSGHEELLDEEQEPERHSYAEKADLEAVDVIGGAIFSADLDISHPLGFGYRSRTIALHKNTEDVLAASDNPYATVIAYDAAPVVSGYVSPTNRDALAGTVALLAERKGEGSVILFADNPNFRAYWYGTNKLFLNALFFSKVFEAPSDR